MEILETLMFLYFFVTYNLVQNYCLQLGLCLYDSNKDVNITSLKMTIVFRRNVRFNFLFLFVFTMSVGLGLVLSGLPADSKKAVRNFEKVSLKIIRAKCRIKFNDIYKKIFGFL